MNIYLRPHHGLCLRHFVGEGYSDGFVENMKRIAEQLSESDQQIVLHTGADIICTDCPNRQNFCCKDEQKIRSLDKSVLTHTNLHNGACISWTEFQQRITDQIINKNKFQQLCSNCCWFSICEKFK